MKIQHSQKINKYFFFKVQNMPYGAKIKVLIGLHSLQSLQGTVQFFFHLFQLHETTYIPWLMVPFSIFKARNMGPSPSHFAMSLVLCSWESGVLLSTLVI